MGSDFVDGSNYRSVQACSSLGLIAQPSLLFRRQCIAKPIKTGSIKENLHEAGFLLQSNLMSWFGLACPRTEPTQFVLSGPGL